MRSMSKLDRRLREMFVGEIEFMLIRLPHTNAESH